MLGHSATHIRPTAATPRWPGLWTRTSRLFLARLTLCVLLIPLAVCTPPRPPEPPLAIVDVSVIPMDRQVLLERQTVVVRAGRIAAIGPTDSTPVPEGALTIAGRGKYLMPGLADMHVHFVNAEHHEAISLLLVANGVTTVRCMWGTPAVLSLRKRIEANRVLGPRIFTAGPITGGPPAVWAGMRLVETEKQAARAVAADKAAGYDAVKVYNRLKPDAYQALVAKARERGLPVVGHVPEAVGLRGVLAARQSSVEHLQGYVQALRPDPAAGAEEVGASSGMMAADDADLSKLPDLVRATREAGVWNCVTLVVHRNITGEGWADDRHELKYVSPSLREAWRSIQEQWKATVPGNDLARYWRGQELQRRIAGALHAGGAPLLLGTDAPNPFVVPGFSALEELELLVGAGLSPYEALRAGTSAPAEFLGKQNEFGTLTVGKSADMILLSANPLTDVRNVARREGVVVRGRWLQNSELQSLLQKLADSY